MRGFNRTVTQRIGVLDDHYLGRNRPVGQDRVLWEIGADGCEVRALRARLGLDAGHTSRLLRALEAARLIVVEPSETDGRVRVARLTNAGSAERDLLVRRSDELATSILAPLEPGQRDELIAAMRIVKRLLADVEVDIRQVDARARRRPAVHQRLRRRAGPALGSPIRPGEWRVGRAPRAQSPRGPVPRRLPPRRGDRLRRGRSTARGSRRRSNGCGWPSRPAASASPGACWPSWKPRRCEAGRSAVRLETNGTLIESIAMYRSSGYVEVAPFNDEPFAHHWFEKAL